MDHDRNFKELLSNFFVEFIDLFLPDVAAYLDRDFTVLPMDKEVFSDIALRDRREVDLVMKVKFRGEDAFLFTSKIRQLRNPISPSECFDTSQSLPKGTIYPFIRW